MTSPAELEALAAKAARHWPIVTHPPVFHARRENIVFRTETQLGPHALRLHRTGYHSQHAILSELEWMAMLEDNGLVVPRPARAADGSLLVQVAGSDGQTRHFSLLSWLPGTPFGHSAEPLHHAPGKRTALMSAIGKNLGKLHRLSDQWTPPQSFHRPPWNAEGLLGEAPLWGPFWSAVWLTPEQRTWLAHIRARCRAALKDYDSAGADYGLIHADLARENVLVDGDQVYFIDFDDCGEGYRMFDIATALIKNIREPDYAALRSALIDGYQRERPLRDADLQRLPLAMVLRSLTYLGWVTERLGEPGMKEKAGRFLLDVEHLWQTHAGEI